MGAVPVTNPGSARCPRPGSVPALGRLCRGQITAMQHPGEPTGKGRSGGCQPGLGVTSAPPSVPVPAQRGFPCWKTLPSASGAALSSTDRHLQVAASFGRAVGPWRRPGSDSEALWGSVVLLSWFCCDLALVCSLCGKAGAGMPGRSRGIPAIPRDPGAFGVLYCPGGCG